MVHNDQRRKLKPSRFNKFEKSDNTPKEPDTGQTAKRGCKRPNEDSAGPSSPKQKCLGLMHPPSTTVNLANNRMIRLKQNLQKEVKVTETSDNNSETKVNVPQQSESPRGISKNIYQNLHKWASPESSSSPNSANNRLSRLKKLMNEKINESPKLNNSPSPLNNSAAQASVKSPQDTETHTSVLIKRNKKYHSTEEHTSPLLRDKINAKRKFDEVASSSQTPNDSLITVDCDVTLVNNTNSPTITNNSPAPKNAFNKHVSVSSRILKIRKNVEEINSFKQPDYSLSGENSLSDIPKSNTPISNRLLSKRQSVSSIVSESPQKSYSADLSFHTFSEKTSSFKQPDYSLSGENSLSDIPKSNTPISNRLLSKRQSVSSTVSESAQKSYSADSSFHTFSEKTSANNYVPMPNVNVKRNSTTSLENFKHLSKSSVPISPQENNSFSNISNNSLDRPKLKRSSTKYLKIENNSNEPSVPYSPQDRLKLKRSSSTSLVGSKMSKTADSSHFKESFEVSTQETFSAVDDNKDLKDRQSLTTDHSKNLNTFVFKEPFGPVYAPCRPSHQPLLPPLPNNVPPVDSDNEFKEKMAMTESWIRNHQVFRDNFPSPPDFYEPGTGVHDVSHNLSSCRSETELRRSPINSCEDMEWANAEPDTVLLENGKNQEIQTEPLKNLESVVQTNQNLSRNEIKDKCLCIVVDTNILISDLPKLTDIMNLKVTGPSHPVLYIPWMVVTELDELKDRSRDKNIKHKSLLAIKFINKALSEDNPRVKGQTVEDMGHQNHIGASPDDKIIGCCLQALKKYESVILLSNDINLKNKAMINNITAASGNEIIMKIMTKLKKDTKSQKIMQKMSILCSEIICDCAKEAYGDVWSKMDMLSKPPWNLLECLKRFKKYWVAVFQEKVMKHFLPAVDKMLHLINHNTSICDDSENYIEFVKLSLNLCIFLKDIENFRGSIENTINEITKIG